MSPDDLAAVHRTWAVLAHRRDELTERLAAALRAGSSSPAAQARARRMVETMSELVGLLATPSRLTAQARAVSARWPETSPPSFGLDGSAWSQAASAVCPSWSAAAEVAWRRAWLLLSEVLTEGSLAPFDVGSRAHDSPAGAGTIPSGARKRR